MVGSDGAQTGDEVAADGCSSGIADINTDGADLRRVGMHAVGGCADVVALDDGAVGIHDSDLFTDGEAFFAVVACTGNNIALGGRRSADAIVTSNHSVLSGALNYDADEQGVADHDVAFGRAVDNQSCEDITLFRLSSAHDVSRGRRPTHITFDRDRGVQRTINLTANNVIAVARSED